jgi:ketosteroid isomerase-like protein
MSQENVKIVQRAYDALRREDWDTYAALHDPECVIFPRTLGVEGGVPYRGHEGLHTFWTDIRGSFADWLPEIEEARDFGDTVVVKAHFRARGKDSGVALDEVIWQAIKIRGGRATWWMVCNSEQEALQAAGLSE